MRLLEKVELKLEWADINRRIRHPWPTHKRAEGRHLTDILRAIAVRSGRLKEDDERDEMPLIMGIGMAIEEFFMGLYPNMDWQPEPVRRDGIVGHMDGLSLLGPIEGVTDHGILDKQTLVVEECKATFKSLRTRSDLNNEWMWIHQPMGYMNMHELRPTHARFHVFYLAGDYTYPLVPRYMRYLYEFGQKELDENWAMIRKYRDLPDKGKS